MNGASGRYRREASCHLSDLRAGVRDQLIVWGVDGLVDDACLVVSELVANACRYGRPPVRATVTLQWPRQGTRRLRIEVSDGGAVIDTSAVRARWRHPSFDLTETGRGLCLVDALCRAWGDRPTAHGHTVWAELTLPDRGNT
ncbi:ATP-binding protein [Streptomyces sp. NPDC006975]|uniref:ATP-binding protein n=1 Tax=Streptomyces sp. NPDC006975 TaxID=3154310 RepID=UPI003455D53D